MKLPNPLCVGIDVSKATLDIAASRDIEPCSVGNGDDGFDVIIAELRKHSCSRGRSGASNQSNSARVDNLLWAFLPIGAVSSDGTS